MAPAEQHMAVDLSPETTSVALTHAAERQTALATTSA